MIRPAQPSDSPAIALLFHETVKTVNCRDYSPSQVAAWAGANPDPHKWSERQKTWRTLVYEVDGQILGFAEWKPPGEVGAVYVHAGHQGRGIASALLASLEQEARAAGIASLSTEASITALPFFTARGYGPGEPQDVMYQGSSFRNYRMKKSLTGS